MSPAPWVSLSATRSRSLRRLRGGPEFANTRGLAIRASWRYVRKGGALRLRPSGQEHRVRAHGRPPAGTGNTVSGCTEAKPNPRVTELLHQQHLPPPERPPHPRQPDCPPAGSWLPLERRERKRPARLVFPARTPGSPLSMGSLRRFSEHTPGAGEQRRTPAPGCGTPVSP